MNGKAARICKKASTRTGYSKRTCKRAFHAVYARNRHANYNTLVDAIADSLAKLAAEQAKQAAKKAAEKAALTE